MFEIIPAKYYHENKERLKKIFLKHTKKSDNMVMNVIQISQKMKNKSLLNIKNNIKE